MNQFSRFLFISVLMLMYGQSYAKIYNIQDYGAVNDGKTNSTAAIQKAINTCSADGGGRVYVPAGIFVTGTLNLKSNIDLYLESGAVLSASANLKDYQSYTVPGYELNYYGVIYTDEAENVSITGQGVIDGNNRMFYDFDHAKKMDAKSTELTRQKSNFRHTTGIGDGPVVPKDRPRQMIIFSRCKNVQVRNVSLLNSFFWTLHFADCDMVNVDGIRLWSGLLIPNADGIDVTSCSNVLITNCDIRVGDDALAITGYDRHFELGGFNGIKRVSENIIVSNCNLQSSSSGIRIGFLDQNTVRNVHVSHVNITNSNRGIGIFLRDEGSLENISFSDMTIETHLLTGDWWGNGEPIHISAIRGKEKVKLGSIKNVSFDNITCKGENGMIIYGSEESIIEDVRFNNVSFEFMNSKLNDVAGGNIDMRGALYKKDMLFASDIPGILARYVSGLSITNFKLKWDPTINQPYFTNGLEVNNFKNLKVIGFAGNSAPSTKGFKLSLTKGDGVLLDNKDGLKSVDVQNIVVK